MYVCVCCFFFLFLLGEVAWTLRLFGGDVERFSFFLFSFFCLFERCVLPSHVPRMALRRCLCAVFASSVNAGTHDFVVCAYANFCVELLLSLLLFTFSFLKFVCLSVRVNIV
uniref:Trypanosoma vivax n=1 Tax=Trypanosoma vivax (strain Y486) TaxID=1055687 RepID=G0UA99_TRYVY|nr:Trypanosoma vivax [Trypanosoma vivax Y486]